MFEVGRKYKIRMIIDGNETTMWQTVEKYEHPLLKFADVEIREDTKFGMPAGTIKGEIINITSPNFISAKLTE